MSDLEIRNTPQYPTATSAVLAFIEGKLASNDPSFTADSLRFFVQNNIIGKASPSTTDRVLRDLRQANKLDYVVLNRGKSLYKAVPLGTRPPVEQ